MFAVRCFFVDGELQGFVGGIFHKFCFCWKKNCKKFGSCPVAMMTMIIYLQHHY